MAFSARTLSLVKTIGVTDFARRAGVDPDSIRHVLAGRRATVALSTANKIVAAFPELCVAEIVLGDASLIPGARVE